MSYQSRNPTLIFLISSVIFYNQMNCAKHSEPDPAMVVAAAEYYAAHEGIPPSKLLIVDLGFLSRPGQSFTTNSHLLSLSRHIFPDGLCKRLHTPELRKRNLEKFRHIKQLCWSYPGAFLLDALPASQRIIVISDGTTPSNIGYINMLQNIRSKTLLHIIINRKRDGGERLVYEVPILSWSRFGYFVLFCNHAIDSTLIVRQLRPVTPKVVNSIKLLPRPCKPDHVHCSVKAVEFKREGVMQARNLDVSAFGMYRHYVCNKTEIRARTAVIFEDIRLFHEDTYMMHVATQRAFFIEDHLTCHTLILRKENGLAALFTSFHSSVWASMAFSFIITASVIALIERGSWKMILWENCIRFMHPIESIVKVQRPLTVFMMSVVMISTQFLTFMYQNEFMSNFLDPEDPIRGQLVQQCRFSSACMPIGANLRRLRYKGLALCGLSDWELSHITWSLHRATYPADKLTAKDFNMAFLGTTTTTSMKNRITRKFEIETVLSSLVERSRIFDLAREHGLSSMQHFESIDFKHRIKPHHRVFYITRPLNFLGMLRAKKHGVLMKGDSLKVRFTFASLGRVAIIFVVLVLLAVAWQIVECLWYMKIRCRVTSIVNSLISLLLSVHRWRVLRMQRVRPDVIVVGKDCENSIDSNGICESAKSMENHLDRGKNREFAKKLILFKVVLQLVRIRKCRIHPEKC